MRRRIVGWAVGALSVLLAACLVHIVRQDRTVDRLREERAEALGQLRDERARLQGEADAAEARSLFFLEKLQEARSRTEELLADGPASGTNGSSARAKRLAARLGEALRPLREELSALGRRVEAAEAAATQAAEAPAGQGETRQALVKRLDALESSLDEALAAPPGALKERLAQIEAAQTEQAKELASVRKSLTETVGSVEQSLEAKLEEMARSVQAPRNELTAVADRLDQLEADVAASSEAAAKRLQTIEALSKQVESVSTAVTEARQATAKKVDELVQSLAEQGGAPQDLVAKIDALASKVETAAGPGQVDLDARFGELRTALETALETDLSEAVSGLRDAISKQGERIAALREDLDAARASGARGGTTAGDSGSRPAAAAPGVRVELVDDEKSLAALGGGRDRGLEVGQMLEVLRDGRVMGQLEVLQVEPDMAAARIVATTPGTSIREGDLARVTVSRPRGGGASPPSGGTDAPPEDGPDGASPEETGGEGSSPELRVPPPPPPPPED